ncbi:MAG: trehalose-6-phosphate synthase, partial [Actinobacteria bacterium]|nr:trehalose-6-phosphate synthase [Actinomycetota bacterium]
MSDLADIVGEREIVVVANRLPVDRVIEPDGSSAWRTSPGGLVTAMEPVVRQLGCHWIGWAGNADERIEPFDLGDMHLVPVTLSRAELSGYYEGFSNGTLWPLYHDVIAPPAYHRAWWEQYEQVNRRFAEATAADAPEGAIVWVHDYQLQLVPAMLRELRPDLTIVFFLHIPFPARRMFAQLPWRRRIVEGLLGADVIGFQREQDALSFRFAAESYAGAPAHGNLVFVLGEEDRPQRSVLAQEFPISIDTEAFAELASRPEVRARAREIREDLGDPPFLLLGIDRLDYTKGIRHRLKAFAELLAEGEVSPEEVLMVQVATPSRERVQAYRTLRNEVETTVGRINGDHGSIGRTPVVYLHQGFSREEMAALYLAADALAVTALRDGMNLVAKEYVACRTSETGVLVLSEFAGAADELQQAVLINPHDIEGMKAAFLRAIHMPEREQRRRMRHLRAVVQENDVNHWAENFLRAASSIAAQRGFTESDETGAATSLTGP